MPVMISMEIPEERGYSMVSHYNIYEFMLLSFLCQKFASFCNLERRTRRETLFWRKKGEGRGK